MRIDKKSGDSVEMEKVPEEGSESEDDTATISNRQQKKGMLLKIAALLVVLALIGTAFFILYYSPPTQRNTPYLSIYISPSQISIPNGSDVRIYAYVNFMNDTDDPSPRNVSNSTSCTITIDWYIGSPNLGELEAGYSGIYRHWDLRSEREGDSQLNWTFKYKDPVTLVTYWANKTMPVSVGEAVLGYVMITPPERMMLSNTSANFTAEAYLTNWTLVDASFTWFLNNSDLGTLSNTTGPKTTLATLWVTASGSLGCNATYEGITVSSYAPLFVSTGITSQTSTRIYDLFNVPLRDYWGYRYSENVLSWTYPVSYLSYGAPAGTDWIYSNYRMNVGSRNISTADTNTNPVYIPITNPNPLIRGGNIHIDWNAGYMQESEIPPHYGPQIPWDWYDGWFFRINGTITMDKMAAKMVLNITDGEFDNFDDWKTNKFDSFSGYWMEWLNYEMNTRLAIKFAYEWDGNILYWKCAIEKVGNEIVLRINDCISWGLESLLSRWWRDTFLPFEGWPDDAHFTADIGPLWSDFDLDACMEYSLIAKTSTRGNQSCWAWEATHGDSITGNSVKSVNGEWVNYSSELNPYLFTTGYWNFIVANAAYNTLAPYDYTPWAWNLSNCDTWSITWPATAGITGYNYSGPGACNDNITGHVDPLWIEPIPGEVPSDVNIDWASRTLEIKGPFDALSWSKTTSGGIELKENWSRLGLLPRGVPYIEFVVNTQTYSQHEPTAVISIPSYTYHIDDSNHDYYASYVKMNQPTTLASGSYDIGGTITNYHWEFGDGTYQDTAGPLTSHTWTGAARNCTVNLTVTNNDGFSSTDSRVVSLTLNLLPTAAFTAPVGICQLPMQFDASASTDIDGSIVSYHWEFGDGATTTTTTPTVNHQYAEMANFEVNLTVTDNDGGTNTTSKNVGIQTELCAKIIMPGSAVVNDIVSLSGVRSFTFDGGKTLVNYTWDFGDGVQGYGLSVVHTWTSVGDYTVKLKVRDSTDFWSPDMIGKIHITTDQVYGLSVSVSRHSLFPTESATLNIKAVNGAGSVVKAATDIVDVNINQSAYGWTGIPTSIALVNGEANITIACSWAGDNSTYNITAEFAGDPTINGSEFVTIANRTIEIRIYDFMQFPLGNDFGLNAEINYWNSTFRGKWGDEAIRYEAPALHISKSYGQNSLQAKTYTTYRMNVGARNITDVSMTAPTFFPRMNTGSGGNASFTWDYHYINLAEFWYWNYKPDPWLEFPQNPFTWSTIDQGELIMPMQFSLYNMGLGSYDGWETFMSINLTMDRDAAYQLIGLPKIGPDPVNWWNTWYWNGPDYERHNDTVKKAIESFMKSEGGGSSVAGRLDIRSCDDGYAWQMGFWGSCQWLFDNGDGTVSMRTYRVGYGEDTLLSRWLYWGGASNGWNYPNGTPNGILPSEPLFDDFHLCGEFDDKGANISLDSGVVYGFRAQKSKDPNVPADTAVWRWEQTRIDNCESQNAMWNRSEMDIWTKNGMTFKVWDPASISWGIEIEADQSQNIMYLKVGQSLIMEKPRTIVSGMMQYPLVGDIAQTMSREYAGFYTWMSIIEKWGNATIHPIGCYPGTAIVDKGTGDLVMAGPFSPKVDYYTTPGKTWLCRDSAPLIEYWIL